MKDKINLMLLEQFKRLEDWSQENILGLFIFNVLLILLLLLRSAGYFTPYLELDINLIVLIGLISAVILLKIRNREIFIIAILFWMFAAFLRMVEVNIWAERTAIYAYESLIVGVVVLSVEIIITYIRKK